MLMSMRSDFLGDLQKDEPLFNVHRQIDVPPLRVAELRDVVSRPAELLSARFETAELAEIITCHAAEDSVKDVGALPLLSYTLDDMWTQMVKGGDGVLRLAAQSFELGGVLVNRANAFLAAHPKEEDQLGRIFTLKLVTVREGEAETRRRALRSEFTDAEWKLVNELVDNPNRLLVTATPEDGETYAEVAHETIFRRWGKLHYWIDNERTFLAWKTGLEGAYHAWEDTPDSTKSDALLMGASLTQAQSWRAKRGQDLPATYREFIDLSTKHESKARAWARHIQALVYVLLVGIIAGLVGWINQSYLKQQWKWYMIVQPYLAKQVRVLSPDAERAVKPGDAFRECKDCPEMIVVPADDFMMGSPPKEGNPNERPQHKATIAGPFAVSKFEVTFDEWDACVKYGNCEPINRPLWEGGPLPMIRVTWDEAKHYAAWLSNVTGKPYRLLSEAEWEYAARAKTQTAYSWGDKIGQGNANCLGCGSQWDGRQTAPVGSFAPNAFGLHDMHGNVWEWVEDCYHPNYLGAPTDGSAWTAGDCSLRVARSGGWNDDPDLLRSAFRFRLAPNFRHEYLGLRVARTLTP